MFKIAVLTFSTGVKTGVHLIEMCITESVNSGLPTLFKIIRPDCPKFSSEEKNSIPLYKYDPFSTLYLLFLSNIRPIFESFQGQNLKKIQFHLKSKVNKNVLKSAPFSALSGKIHLHSATICLAAHFFYFLFLSYAAEHSAVGNTVRDAMRGIRA